MVEINVAIFGRFEVQADGRPVKGIEANKVKELLCYLLIYRGRMLLRESLAEMFWESTLPAKSKKYLRQAIWKLKAVLEEYCQGAACNLVVETGWIRFDPSSERWCVDLIDFEQTYLALKEKRARELGPAEFIRLRREVDLYKGDLLEGWYQDWCIPERERFQVMYLLLLNKLVQYCEIHQQVETGLVYGEKLIHYDRAYERGYRQMMRMYYMAGDRTQALRQYQRCVAALADELGVGPSERTIELYEQIKSDQHPHRAKAPVIQSDERLANSQLKNSAKRLDEYAETLSLVQSQIQEEIISLENRFQTGQ
jgi:DNA-binding SARP family transcriptional activator